MTDRFSDGLVLFGGGGDLALRMLLPSLAYLESENLLPPGMPVIACARSPMDDEGFRALVREALVKRAPEAAASAPRIGSWPARATWRSTSTKPTPWSASAP